MEMNQLQKQQTRSITFKANGFRLLNSEIGNNRTSSKPNESARDYGFRLLNSEIGNNLFLL